MTSSTHRLNSEVLTATLELDGKKVVDVGCGDGNLVRLMTRHGAKAFGVECSAKQLAKAHDAKPAGGEIYYDGKAESLPFDSGSIDIVVFFNSLHHVPEDNMKTALEEAARVLKPSGILYVCEPIAEGPHFDLMQPVHDETHVRAKAYETARNPGNINLSNTNEFTYIHSALHPNFATFKEQMLRINPHRADDFDAGEDGLKAAFERLGTPGKDGVAFDQPMRVNLLMRA